MEGFRIFFLVEIHGADVKELLLPQEIEAEVFQYEGLTGVDVVKADAKLCTIIYRRDQIEKEDLDNREEWPIQLDQVGSMMYVEVRRQCILIS